ncbi:hypothetical protein VB620_04575 [Nodularia harveyana UHCC-0300]|uniref:Uncharacterized protein n=1 Tax=Nodularia harveyana UHCC-0300 TaxID=2974287 RepID=A0ABU5UAR3_9CYAN|nr:hypothetical protein [Nodularia harveyana]MEA5580615.1 hypothetical protein [Nodularia harveyana UHCC-0300]
MSQNLSFIPTRLQLRQALTTFIVVGVVLCSLGLNKLQPAIAQRISPGDIWQQVYQEIPDLPKENQYISKDTGTIAEENTLVSRLITYHIYRKGRAPNYRLDWKLTLADYLNANEIIYDHSYPGNDTLKQNPLESDRTVITNLTRQQRNQLVQVLTDIFNPTSQNSQTTPTPKKPQLPQTGGAELLK